MAPSEMKGVKSQGDRMKLEMTTYEDMRPYEEVEINKAQVHRNVVNLHQVNEISRNKGEDEIFAHSPTDWSELRLRDIKILGNDAIV